MRPAPPAAANFHRQTLLEVVSLIEHRVADLDRLGPPNAPGFACNACRDGELHRLLGVLRDLAGAGRR